MFKGNPPIQDKRLASKLVQIYTTDNRTVIGYYHTNSYWYVYDEVTHINELFSSDNITGWDWLNPPTVRDINHETEFQIQKTIQKQLDEKIKNPQLTNCTLCFNHEDFFLPEYHAHLLKECLSDICLAFCKSVEVDISRIDGIIRICLYDLYAMPNKEGDKKVTVEEVYKALTADTYSRDNLLIYQTCIYARYVDTDYITRLKLICDVNEIERLVRYDSNKRLNVRYYYYDGHPICPVLNK